MYESEDKMVSHPSHYQGANGMEVIDVIENFTCDLVGKEATNTGQIIKYILRWKKKNGLQDLEKTMWYLQRLIDIVRSGETSEEVIDIKAPGDILGVISEKPSWLTELLNKSNKSKRVPGLRCKGCIYDGDFCLSTTVCTCDRHGKYTNYTLALPVVITLDTLEQIEYLIGHISKTFDKFGYISMAGIEAILGRYDIFPAYNMLYKTSHGWTKESFSFVVPTTCSICLSKEVPVDADSLYPAVLAPCTGGKSYISIIDLNTHKVIETYESAKRPVIVDDAYDNFAISYTKKNKVITKSYDKKKVTYSLAVEKEN